MSHSEENGGIDCLNLLPGNVKFFGNDLADGQDNKLKVPHMGWNNVYQTQEHPLWQGIEQDSRFYFVHSYYVDAVNNPNLAATCGYGLEFAAAVCQKISLLCSFIPRKVLVLGCNCCETFVNGRVSTNK